MADFSFSTSGLKELRDRIAGALPRAKKTVSSELYAFGEEVMGESKEVYVPVRTGALMNSGKVLPPAEEGETISARMGYGDEAVGYALYVHEALEGAEPPSENWSWTKKVRRGGAIDWTRPGSGPKYLERPLNAKREQFPARIGNAFKGAI